jgi:hypothetical protein
VNRAGGPFRRYCISAHTIIRARRCDRCERCDVARRRSITHRLTPPGMLRE